MPVATIPMVEDSMQQAHLHRAHQQGARASQPGQSMSEPVSEPMNSRLIVSLVEFVKHTPCNNACLLNVGRNTDTDVVLRVGQCHAIWAEIRPQNGVEQMPRDVKSEAFLEHRKLCEVAGFAHLVQLLERFVGAFDICGMMFTVMKFDHGSADVGLKFARVVWQSWKGVCLIH